MSESPCVAVCALDSDDICIDCGRTSAEITEYREASADRRREINGKAEKRLLGAINNQAEVWVP